LNFTNATGNRLDFFYASGTSLDITNISFINATATKWRVLGNVGIGTNPVVQGNNIIQINTSNNIPNAAQPFSAFEIDSEDGNKSDFSFRLSSSSAFMGSWQNDLSGNTFSSNALTGRTAVSLLRNQGFAV
jgi:hypothetical protein